MDIDAYGDLTIWHRYQLKPTGRKSAQTEYFHLLSDEKLFERNHLIQPDCHRYNKGDRCHQAKLDKNYIKSVT